MKTPHGIAVIFDMNFVLPPLVEMAEVVKDMPTNTAYSLLFPNWC
jgi:hypothetical protein